MGHTFLTFSKVAFASACASLALAVAGAMSGSSGVLIVAAVVAFVTGYVSVPIAMESRRLRKSGL